MVPLPLVKEHEAFGLLVRLFEERPHAVLMGSVTALGPAQFIGVPVSTVAEIND
jgi:hypothetical protein